MSLYHITEKGNPGRCTAKPGSCPLAKEGDHYPNPTEARNAYEAKNASAYEGVKKNSVVDETQEAILFVKAKDLRVGDEYEGSPITEKKQSRGKAFKPSLVPILLEPSTFPMPLSWHLNNSQHLLTEATDSGYVDYYSSEYSEPTSIYLDRAVAVGIGVEEKDWPQDLRSLIDTHREEWGNVDNWTFENGFYDGDSPDFHAPAGLEDQLQSWYYSQPNAIDAKGVLEHVREKGYDTAGHSPVEAVKKMLKEENGTVLKRVENARSLGVTRLSFTNISYAKPHYDRIEAIEPEVVSPRSSEILGVVLNGQGHQRLLDGHHRFKWAGMNNRTDGTFIVLY